MEFNTSYLNRTANKWPRQASQKIEFIVWHETASPNPDNPYGTLDYNLSPRVQSSYNYLIARNGTIFHYVDETKWISYHAGVHSAARGYTDWSVNLHSIGVEVDGRNDGTPITTAQRDAIIALMIYFKDKYAIPIDRAYHLAHKQVAPGYKSDPRGLSLDVAIPLAQKAAQGQQPAPVQPPTPPPAPTLGEQLRAVMYRATGNEYHPEWNFHQHARKQKLGAPLKLGLDFQLQGQRYLGEIYGRDAIFSPHGQWTSVLQLSQLKTQNRQLFDALMSKVYSELGVIFNSGQAFYQYSLGRPVGFPLGTSTRLRISSGAVFVTQPYTLDVLYTPIAVPEQNTRWDEVRELEEVLASPGVTQAQRDLAAVAYQLAYARISARFDANDAFWKAATQRRLGLPLAANRQETIGGKSYTCACFGGDMLYARSDTPNSIQALSETP